MRTVTPLRMPSGPGPKIDVPKTKLGHGDLVPYAYEIARRAHAGQVDKAGADYLGHPSRIVARLGSRAVSDELLAIAWLHDVVEDTSVTLQALWDIGFPSDVVNAVDALSRRPTERNPLVYCRRVASNRLALIVKLADIEDNSDPDRLALLPEDTAERLSRKYASAVAALTEFAPKRRRATG